MKITQILSENTRLDTLDVTEVCDDTLKSYQQKVSADTRKNKLDPTKRSPEKASRSVAGVAKAHNRLEKGVTETISPASQARNAAARDYETDILNKDNEWKQTWLQKTINFANKTGFQIKTNPSRTTAIFINKQLGFGLQAMVKNNRDDGLTIRYGDLDGKDNFNTDLDPDEFYDEFVRLYKDAKAGHVDQGHKFPTQNQFDPEEPEQKYLRSFLEQGVAEDSSESKSNVTSAITDFYKTQLSQSKPGKVENYNSKAKELLSQATGKQRAKVLTMLKAGSKNPYLQGVIITIVGSIVSGAVIKHFGSMGLSPQQFNMILQGSMNSIIPTLAAKLHGMSWSDAIKTGLASVAVGVGSAGIMENNAEYDDESGMAHTDLHTIIRAAEGLLDTIDDNENLPEWVQEKIAKVEDMIVSSWDYLKSQEEQGIDPRVDESNWLEEELNKLDEVAAWQKKSGKNKNGGLNQKGVNSYRREHPGSKLQTAVTTKPSKLKPGSKAAKRRKSFCARMSGMKGPMKDEHGKPTRKALSLRKWNC